MTDGTTKLLAGTSEVVITPPVGVPLVTRPSVGVHDELYARALVLGDGQKRVAIVCLDLTGTDFGLADEIRERIQQRTDIDMVLLNCSHTHSAPFTIPYGVENWRWLQNEGRTWRDELSAKITEMVCSADSNLTDAVVRVGREAVRIGVNRQLELEGAEGKDKAATGQGLIPWVDVLRIDGPDGEPMVILFGYAAHPVIVHHASDLLSADYPGYAAATIKKHFGEKTMAMFAQGCGGDINGEPLNSGFEAAEKAGVKLGQAVIKAAGDSVVLEVSKLRSLPTQFEVPLSDSPTYEDCQLRLAEVEAGMSGAAGDELTTEQAWWGADQISCLRDLMEKRERAEMGTLRFEAHALAFDDNWCLLAMPHEMFSEYQRWIDQISPFARTMVMGYTNACESYMPTDRDIEIGGPESSPFGAPLWYHHRLAPKVGLEKLIKQKLAKLLTQLHNEKD